MKKYHLYIRLSICPHLFPPPTFLSFHFAFWIASLKYTSVASSVVLVTTHPIFVGIGRRLFLKERIGMNLVLGIALSVLGSGLISCGDMSLSKETLMGDGFALSGAIAASGYLLVGRKMRKDRDLLSCIFSCLFNGRIDLDSPFRYFSKIILGIFIVYLSLSPRPRPSIGGAQDFQWGPEISSSIRGCHCHLR